MVPSEFLLKFKEDINNWQPFINGQFEAGGCERILADPATGDSLCRVSECDPGQVEKAILAARHAFDRGSWRRLAAAGRARILHQLADKLEAMAGPLAMVETLNQGKPVRESRGDVADAVACLRYYAGLAARGQGSGKAAAGATVVREPIGVCGQIAAWNFPLLLAVWKLAPALAAGNTCVLKPSEFTPLTALMLARALQDLDLPPGVVNVVLGDGSAVGQPLAESPRVDKISFTGSAATGRAVARAALGNLKKVALELGGKSPVIVFADQDLETAVDYALYAAYCNAGQICSAGTRFIVQDPVHGEFVRRLAERAGRIVVGPGADPGTEMGPLIHGRHLDRVQGYIRAGLAEGARLEAGAAPCGAAGSARGSTWSPPCSAAPSPACASSRRRSSGRWRWCSASPPRPRRWIWPTGPVTGWPGRSSPGMPSGPSGWPGPSGPGSSGSTATTTAGPNDPGAASRKAGGDGNWGPSAWTPFAKPSS